MAEEKLELLEQIPGYEIPKEYIRQLQEAQRTIRRLTSRQIVSGPDSLTNQDRVDYWDARRLISREALIRFQGDAETKAKLGAEFNHAWREKKRYLEKQEEN